MRFFNKLFRKKAKNQEESSKQSEPSETLYAGSISMKLSGRGKCIFLERSPGKYTAIAKNAAYQTARVHCYVYSDMFRHIMREHHVPETMIEDYLNSYRLDDDRYLHPGEAAYLGKLYGRGKCWFSAQGPAAI